MANGHGYSLNPFDNDDDSMEDSVEYRLMMAYAKRRRPKRDGESPAQTVKNGPSHPKGPSSPQTPAEGSEKTTPKKKKKKGWKRLFKCIKPQMEEEEEESDPPDMYKTCAVEIPSVPEVEEEEEKGKLEEVAGRLTAIAKEIPFTAQEVPSTPTELQTDSPEDDDEVERMIGLLLREAGDKLNAEELKDADISAALFGKYDFFEKLITTLLKRMGLVTATPSALGPQASPKTQIAVTCEVTSRLSAVQTLPMSRMLDHGARYLQKYYSTWAQEQGGYEEAFHDDDDDIQ
ncbi:Apoptosis facilitator [Collichthys lucidus]|uniref:Apoptosis facilitator n=1 Tax=Collichthys lucidus TaxID=240159 RepID=A0A4U5VRC3_COLLU|nr:Apoptosis facilitator [Collichthys lucidus]